MFGICWHIDDDGLAGTPDDVYLWRETSASFGATDWHIIDQTSDGYYAAGGQQFDRLTVSRTLDQFETNHSASRFHYFESPEWAGHPRPPDLLPDYPEGFTAHRWWVFGPRYGFDISVGPGRRWLTIPQRPGATTFAFPIMAAAAAHRYTVEVA